MKSDKLVHEFSDFICFSVFNIWNASAQSINKHSYQTLKQRLYQIMIVTRIPLPCLLLALFYMSKLRSNLSQVFTGAEYRVFGSALVLAQKYLDDNRYTNRTWSKILNVPLKDLNEMEMELLKQINYDIHVDTQEYKCWLAQTQTFASQHHDFVQHQGFAIVARKQSIANTTDTPSLNPTLHAL